MTTVAAIARPNLALVKYWGKSSTQHNLPATPSIGITLDGLRSRVELSAGNRAGEDRIVVDGVEQDPHRFTPFFDILRERANTAVAFHLTGSNDYPAAAGLASSAAGFAAAALAGTRLLGLDDSPSAVSSLARMGSASAARSAYGGFCLLKRDAESAVPLYDKDWWPELKLLVAVVSPGKKAVSSRKAMEQSRLTSPYYRAWVDSAPGIAADAKEALGSRNLEALGACMRRSYLGMFATIYTADPPVFYWLPGSVAVIRRCEELRQEGVAAWETMDAGPQVKILTLETELPRVRKAIESLGVCTSLLFSDIGDGPRIVDEM